MTFFRPGGYRFRRRVDRLVRRIADNIYALLLEPNNADTKQRLVDTYKARGEKWFNQNDLNRAIADFESVLRVNPAYEYAKMFLFMIYHNRGNDYHNKKDWNNAVADYEMALRFNADTSTQQALDKARQQPGR